jgi:hypothetical protein
MIKLIDILKEITQFSNWKLPDTSQLKQEFKDMLEEGKQVGILYHGTNSINSFFEILNSDTLKTHYDVTSHYHKEYSGNPRASISLTRTKQTANDYPIYFELDGNKISNNYRIIPFRDQFALDGDEGEYEGTKLNNNEFEERIYKNITNLHKYIIKVIIKKALIEREINILKSARNLPYTPIQSWDEFLNKLNNIKNIKYEIKL